MENPVSPEVRVFPDLDALSKAAAREIEGVIADAVAAFGRCAIALAGGGTPRRLYERLAEEHAAHIPWSHLHLFWGDERCAPTDHESSNVHMARQALINRVEIPDANVHAPSMEPGSPADVASDYERELRSHFRDSGATHRSWPVFDLVLLGVGPDGHTASLFPGSAALDAGDRWVAAAQAPSRSELRDRITLTMPVLNHARTVFVLASGSAKQAIVREILETPETAVLRYPAAQVYPRGRLVWWVDRAAIGLETPTS